MVPEFDPKECRAWVFANVIRWPKMGDLYTLWKDDHAEIWSLHGIVAAQGDGDAHVLFLTMGFHFVVWMTEWETLVRQKKLRFTGRNHLYSNET
jgi:hypothetical protein